MELIPLLLLVLICCALLIGYPVAFTLAGVSILFALICIPFGIFDPTIFGSIPLRIFGIMNNITLLAVPMFILMGTILENSGFAAKMLENMLEPEKNLSTSMSLFKFRTQKKYHHKSKVLVGIDFDKIRDEIIKAETMQIGSPNKCPNSGKFYP